MPLKNYVERGLVACDPHVTVYQIAELMKEANVGAVLVVDKGKPKGIVTDRDIVLRCIAEKMGCEDTTAAQVMSRSIETVGLDEGFYNVVKKMKNGGVRRIPIVDESGKAVALLSFDDVFDLIAEELNDLRNAIQARRLMKISTQEAA